MKRSRPRQHTRIIKTKKGRKKIVINRGIKSRKNKVKRKRLSQPYDYNPEQVKYVQGIINNKTQSNIRLGSSARKAREDLLDADTIREKTFLDEKLTSIRKEVAGNNQSINRLQKTYELGKFRRGR